MNQKKQESYTLFELIFMYQSEFSFQKASVLGMLNSVKLAVKMFTQK